MSVDFNQCSSEIGDILHDAEQNGTSFSLNMDVMGRDACFDLDQLYAVFERSDLEQLYAKIHLAMGIRI